MHFRNPDIVQVFKVAGFLFLIIPSVLQAQYHLFRNNKESVYLGEKWAPWEESATHIGITEEGKERFRLDIHFERHEKPDMQLWVRYTRMEGAWYVYTIDKAHYQKSDLPSVVLEEDSHNSEILAKNKLSRMAQGDKRNAVINLWIIGTGYAYILADP